MKRFVWSVLIILILSTVACKKDKVAPSKVRFENIMTDKYIFPYGLKFGDAMYGGSLGFQETTPYLETESGPYYVMARRVDGEWIDISVDQFYVLPGLSYTILIFGTVEKFAFQISKD